MDYQPIKITVLKKSDEGVVVLDDPNWPQQTIIICLNQIAYIEQHDIAPSVTQLHMSNGDVLFCTDVPYKQWENDCYVLRSS